MGAFSDHLCNRWMALVPALVLAMLSAAFADGNVTQAQLDFFETRVRPVLVEHCYECHSAAAKKLKGGLRLDSRRSLLLGGETGPAVLPGQPNASLLVEAIRYESLEMPPRGKLPDRIVADLVTWIEMGAPDPRVDDPPVALPGESLRNREQHWAFQPVSNAPPPKVDDRTWPKSTVDQFILSRLERAGVRPVGDADRFTWLRRVSLDLTGLPPTVDEIRAFTADPSSAAKERVVDRLIASRAFGERWARHWLDLVGYADQIGTSNDVFAEHAWRYRDYVIDSLNNDVPFDQFIREQIAGDLLDYPTAQQKAAAIIATGFLVLGDLEIVEADKAKLQVDIVDQQVVKTSKAFLGLTVGCARCHDHKFDPISQRDYYAMAGFFYNCNSVYKTDRGVWSDVIDRELPETDAERSDRARKTRLHEIQLAEWKAEQQRLNSQKAAVEARLGKAETDREELTKQRDQLNQRISELGRRIVHAEFFTPRVPRTYGVRDVEEPQDMRITIRGNPRALGDSVPRGFVAVVAQGFESPRISANQSGRRELADWLASEHNPLTARVAVNRIWQKLFGTGLVASVDYFGVRGDDPTHPELLDYLARQFMRNGWSRKDLIRSLVLSRTYGASSRHDDLAYSVDPANKLLWRMNRRRLDAEALRDSMLAISGSLQNASGGPSLPLEYVENVGNVDPENVNPPSFSLRRYRPEQPLQRTLYLPIIRSAGQPGPAELRNVFDFPQPALFTGRRATTAVPTQALFLMNSPQVKRHAADLAECIRRESECQTERLELLWMHVLNRLPTDEEREQARMFLDDSDMAELCRALLSTNEFMMTL